MNNYENFYGIRLLDDLHNFFPDILYNNQRFNTVRDLLQYITLQTQEHFNLYNRGLRHYMPRSQPTNVSNDDEMNYDPFGLRRTVPIIPLRRPTAATTTTRTPRVNIVSETIDIAPMFGPTIEETNSDTNFLSNLLNLLQTNSSQTILRQFNEPVIVSPTQEQINNATKTMTATNLNEESICSICQDNYTSNQTLREIKYCEHFFHKDCIDHWFEQHVHCPVCRFDIRDTETNNDSETN